MIGRVFNLGAEASTIEEPTGAINGENRIFTLSSVPTGTVKIMLNGLILKTEDYAIFNSTIVLTEAPIQDDELQVEYN